MEYGTIEREIHIDASPEVVFDVVSSPEHLREWWPDEAEYPAVAGGAGRIGFGDCSQGGTWVQFTVVDADPAAAVLVPLDPRGGRDGGAGQLVPGASSSSSPPRGAARCCG